MKLKSLFGTLLVAALSFSALVSVYYYQEHKELKRSILSQTVKEAQNQLTYTEREFKNMRAQMASVSELLGHSSNLYEFILNPIQSNADILEEVWMSIALNQKWFTQIRFIDIEGVEQVRVNYDLDKDIALAASDLQDKSNRDYFLYAQQLEDGEIGTWGVDLEVEYGQYVYPPKPTMRIIEPVVIKGVRYGYIVLNIDVQFLAASMIYSPIQDFNIEVVNSDGFYIASDDTTKLFGNIFEQSNGYNLSQTMPEVWGSLKNGESGYFLTDTHLIAYSNVYFSRQKPLYLLIELSNEQLYERASQDFDALIQEASFVLLLMLVLTVPFTLFTLQYRRYSLDSKLARAALDGMTSVMITDTSHRVIKVNSEFESLFGHSSLKIEGKNAFKLLSHTKNLERAMNVWAQIGANGVWEGEVVCATKLGQPFTAIVRIQAIKAAMGQVSYYITTIVDITERKALEERLRNLSERDELSGLWNRRKFEQQLQENTNLIKRYEDQPAACLALVDIDHFKRINDQCGHDVGDRVIKNISDILVNGVRNTDFVARVGGEEFAIIMPNTSLESAEIVLNRLREATESQQDMKVTISVGYTDLSADRTQSYKCADIALYESKTAGRNRVSLCKSTDEIA